MIFWNVTECNMEDRHHYFGETFSLDFVTMYQSTQPNMSKDCTHNTHCCENLRSLNWGIHFLMFFMKVHHSKVNIQETGSTFVFKIKGQTLRTWKESVSFTRPVTDFRTVYCVLLYKKKVVKRDESAQ
jgi:hypothetical protein